MRIRNYRNKKGKIKEKKAERGNIIKKDKEKEIHKVRGKPMERNAE